MLSWAIAGKDCKLCISTSKRVLCMSFAGWNHLLQHLNKFSHLFPSQTGKKRKISKNNIFSFFFFFFQFFSFFSFFSYFSHLWREKMKQHVFTFKKIISTSQRHEKHPFTGLNTQHLHQNVSVKAFSIAKYNPHCL